MKRIFLMLVVAAGLLVPSLALVGSAGAANPWGPKGDPNSSCGGGEGGAPCSNPGLTQSNGCNANSSDKNPHCQPAATTAPTTPAAPAGAAPAQQGEANQGGPGAEGNEGAAGAAQGGAAAGEELPFTGVETLWLALLGAGMLASGLALRARSESSL